MLMKTHTPQNERIKRAYFTYLAEAKGFSDATLDAVAKALNRFEDIYQVPGLQGVPHRASQGLQGEPRRTDEYSDQGSPKQGDALLHAERPEAVLHLAGRAAGV